MAEGQELEPAGTEGEDFLIIRKRGHKIVVPIRKTLPDGTKEPYSDNPQVRAHQLVYEGRIGGNRNGGENGGGGRKKRISAAIVEEAQDRLQSKIIRVVERGLSKSAGMRNNLATVKLIADMDHHEASLALKEEELDLSKQNRSELIGTLAALLEDPTTEVALEGVIEGTYEEITDAEEVGTEAEDSTDGQPGEVHLGGGSESSNGDSSDEGRADRATATADRDSGEAQENGADTGEAGDDGRGAPASDRPPRRNPWVEIAEGRSDD
jgi:hypothetical protein